MRLRDQIVEEARAIIRAELSDATPDGVVSDVATLVASVVTPEDAMRLGAMFAALDRIRSEWFATAQAQEPEPTGPAEDVGLTD